MREVERLLEVYEDHFWTFYNAQPEKVKEKLDYTLQIVITVRQIPQKFFKHLDDGLYEIRINVASNIYRIFCFLEADQRVILLNGFQKKTQKIPKKELEKAQRLKAAYYSQKD